MLDLGVTLFAILLTLSRVFITIILSIVTGWFLAYVAIKNKTFENVYISLSEILESVPVISFFPVVLIFFVLVIGGQLGIQLAVIFLVFTAVVWNIWMGIYQAFKTIPENLLEVSENYRFGFLGKMARLYIPYSIPRISANLIPSFADALFYITVSEVFSIGTKVFQVFGIGTLIADFTAEGDYTDALYALGILAVFTTLITFLLREYAEYSVQKYGLDTEERESFLKRGRIRVRYTARLYSAKSAISRLSKYLTKPPYFISRRERDKEDHEKRKIKLPNKIIGRGIGIVILVILSYLTYTVVSSVSPSTWSYIISTTPFDLVNLAYDYARVAFIALLSFLFAVFLGYYFATRPIADRIGVPIIQSIAAFPAPAYFPLLYGFTYSYVSSVLGPFTNEFYVILLGFVSTFYYIFYSFWLGVKNLPSEYWEIMKNYKMGFRTRMRRVLLPGTFPYIVAGLSSTINSAWGGLAIGEYWPDIFAGHTLEVKIGLMKAIALADNHGDLALVGWLSLIFAIVVVIYSILFTRRMMDLAREKYVAEEGVYAA
ncbi:sugar ABC transporter permease [Candidatus Acidianus copahuensis]|uniref:Sugar ABC transporter permease n=1 Tax=Candidatus Acidianus copahuensis TaxID=1160895 RepID=A0A031LTQ1_9CREN|nr:ABC transporter permease subunit [Candidatus Acidianus copahuensis]EZQ11105.1 sugar ABC transporter permease [Candidatus Acidianus copahuensis]